MDDAIDSHPKGQRDPVRENLYDHELRRTRDPQGRHKEPATALVRELLGEILRGILGWLSGRGLLTMHRTLRVEN